jgi:pyruvate dehydrogenase E1 component alpha subunit
MSEALNLAAVESASVLFICQNNGWAISKPSHEQMLTSIANRANGFGVRSWSISADDPDSTYLACLEARRYVETSASPGLIELRTNRIGGHTTTDPHASYREPDELAAAVANDPVVKYRDTLVALGVVDDEWLGALDTEVATARQELIKAFAS